MNAVEESVDLTLINYFFVESTTDMVKKPRA